jgi:hypothetical protein
VKRHISTSTLLWVGAALAGLVIAVAVSFAASQLSKPRVGLASEPVSGVTALAPRSPRSHGNRSQPRATQPPPPSDDGQSGGGEAGDDD